MQGAQQIPQVFNPPTEPARPAVLYPPWMDPLYMLRASKTVITPLTIPAASVLDIAGNPARWAIGFGYSDPAGVEFPEIAPDGSPANIPLARLNFAANIPACWFTLFTHGPYVTGGWRIAANAGVVLTMWEIVIYQGAIYATEPLPRAEGLPIQDGSAEIGSSGSGRDGSDIGSEPGALLGDDIGSVRSGRDDRQRGRNPKRGGK